MVPVYYYKEPDGTIISPNNVQQFYKSIYHGFHLFCDYDNITGQLKFYNRDGINHATFKEYSQDNLWYHVMIDMKNQTSEDTCIHPTMSRLNSAAKYELWHQRLLHPGTTCMSHIHKFVDGTNDPLKETASTGAQPVCKVNHVKEIEVHQKV